jgi:hypothetical protein
MRKERETPAMRCSGIIMGRLAEAIRDCGKTQKEIATATGYNEGYISLLANEKRGGITLYALGTILHACGYEVASIKLRGTAKEQA